jgi:hypothetical protein
MKTFELNENEKSLLFKQDEVTKSDGGWQSLMVNLQNQFNEQTMVINLDEKILEKIPRYAYKYGQGGWENRLTGIFYRHMRQKFDDYKNNQ